MPTYTQNIEIDVKDFLSDCSNSEIREIIQFLEDEEYIHKDSSTIFIEQGWGSVYETRKKLNELSQHVHKFSTEEEEFLERMYKRYL